MFAAEDIYAIHLLWEAEQEGMISEIEYPMEKFKNQLSKAWDADDLSRGTWERFYRLSSKLNYPQRHVAVLS